MAADPNNAVGPVGKVTTSDPTYVHDNTGYFSLTTAGRLRVDATGGSGTSLLVGGTATTASPTYVTSTTNPLSLTLKGGLRSALIDSSGNELNYTATQPVYQSLFSPSDLSSVATSIASATTTSIVAAVASQTTRVHQIIISIEAAQKLTFNAGSGNIVLNFAGAGLFSLLFQARPYATTAVNTAFTVTSTTTGQTNITTYYVTSA